MRLGPSPASARPARTGTFPARWWWRGFGTSPAAPQDVQSHTHLVLLSQILCADGKWRAIDWKRTLYERGVKKMLGAIYRTEMAYQLQSRLGLQVERLQNAKSQDTSLYDLSVMQKRFKPLLDELSKRRDQVLKLLAKKGEGYDARKAAKATLDSRPASAVTFRRKRSARPRSSPPAVTALTRSWSRKSGQSRTAAHQSKKSVCRDSPPCRRQPHQGTGPFHEGADRTGGAGSRRRRAAGKCRAKKTASRVGQSARSVSTNRPRPLYHRIGAQRGEGSV